VDFGLDWLPLGRVRGSMPKGEGGGGDPEGDGGVTVSRYEPGGSASE
jgi:hypothetical protein